MADDEMLQLKEELVIEQLYTFLYLELPKHFQAIGEKHDFWELVYVDKGEIAIDTDLGSSILGQGDMIFYAPNEFHTGNAVNGTTPNLLILSFVCHSPAMQTLRGKVIRLEQTERNMLFCLLTEGKQAFDPPVGSPELVTPQRRANAPFGCEQVIKNQLELMLILLIRKEMQGKGQERSTSVFLDVRNEELFERSIAYLRANIGHMLTFQHICSEFALSGTVLKSLFKRRAGSGVMEYFSQLKLDYAKQHIRQKLHSMTEIADQLGYSSVHSFSKQFKKATGYTPTEYARTIANNTAQAE